MPWICVIYPLNCANLQVLDIKKGQAKAILRELARGRVGRHAANSLIVQFHIKLFSLIQKNKGEKYATLLSCFCFWNLVLLISLLVILAGIWLTQQKVENHGCKLLKHVLPGLNAPLRIFLWMVLIMASWDMIVWIHQRSLEFWIFFVMSPLVLSKWYPVYLW